MEEDEVKKLRQRIDALTDVVTLALFAFMDERVQKSDVEQQLRLWARWPQPDVPKVKLEVYRHVETRVLGSRS